MVIFPSQQLHQKVTWQPRIFLPCRWAVGGIRVIFICPLYYVQKNKMQHKYIILKNKSTSISVRWSKLVSLHKYWLRSVDFRKTVTTCTLSPSTTTTSQNMKHFIRHSQRAFRSWQKGDMELLLFSLILSVKQGGECLLPCVLLRWCNVFYIVFLRYSENRGISQVATLSCNWIWPIEHSCLEAEINKTTTSTWLDSAGQ